ncbi:MAG: pitrilysin family protein [Candidatus Micrarchaeaceae archaeon]
MKVDRLENGLMYVLYPLEANYLAIHLEAFAGSMNEVKKSSAHLLEHTLFSGTDNMTARDINDILAFNAPVRENATADYDIMDINALTTWGRAKKIIKLFGDISYRSIFPEEAVSKEKETIQVETNSMREDVTTGGAIRAVKSLFKNRKIEEVFDLPTDEEIDSLSRDDVIKEYNDFFKPNNMVLTLYGRFEQSDAEKAIYESFSPLEGKSKPIDFSEIKADGRRKNINIAYDSMYNAEAILTFPAPVYRIDNDKERTNISVIIDIIEKRLERSLREDNGLVYYVSAEYAPLLRIGYININMQSRHEKFKRAKELMYKEIEKLHRGEIDADEIEKHKEMLFDAEMIEEYIDPLDSSKIVGSANLLYRLLSDDKETYTHDIAEMPDVTLDSIREAADKYMDLDRSVTVSMRRKGSSVEYTGM